MKGSPFGPGFLSFPLRSLFLVTPAFSVQSAYGRMRTKVVGLSLGTAPVLTKCKEVYKKRAGGTPKDPYNNATKGIPYLLKSQLSCGIYKDTQFQIRE